MKFSSKVQKCGLSPMRKFHPYAVAAEAKGRNIYHLNIGQPDIETPKAFFDAVRSFDLPVLEYAPSPGVPGTTMLRWICTSPPRISSSPTAAPRRSRSP